MESFTVTCKFPLKRTLSVLLSYKFCIFFKGISSFRTPQGDSFCLLGVFIGDFQQIFGC